MVKLSGRIQDYIKVSCCLPPRNSDIVVSLSWLSPLYCFPLWLYFSLSMVITLLRNPEGLGWEGHVKTCPGGSAAVEGEY